MSHSTGPGAQQYSDEELVAIADEAHRADIRVAAHAIGDRAVRACIRAGIDCIEHGFLASDETLGMMVEHGTFLVSTTYLTDAMDIARAAPELQKKAAEVFPKARAMLPKAIAAGVKIACGTDAPPYPTATTPRRSWRSSIRGMTPDRRRFAPPRSRAPSSSTMDDELGRLAPATSPTSSPCPATPPPTSPPRGRPLRHEGRPRVLQRLILRLVRAGRLELPPLSGPGRRPRRSKFPSRSLERGSAGQRPRPAPASNRVSTRSPVDLRPFLR